MSRQTKDNNKKERKKLRNYRHTKGNLINWPSNFNPCKNDNPPARQDTYRLLLDRKITYSVYKHSHMNTVESSPNRQTNFP